MKKRNIVERVYLNYRTNICFDEKTFLDEHGNKTGLSEKEYFWFRMVADWTMAVLEIDVPVFCADFRNHGNVFNPESYGCIFTDRPDDPVHGRFIIFIDNSFIKSCYSGKSERSLKYVLCHEAAHTVRWSDDRRHKRYAKKMYDDICMYSNDRKTVPV